MKVFVIGLWHTGCVISSCLASLNHNVIAYDSNKKLINKLKKKITPIYEPGLKDLIEKTLNKKKLSYTNSLDNLNNADIIWFTYDTPIDDYDQADTKQVLDKIKSTLKILNSKKYVIISSQLPVGSIKSLESFSEKVLKKEFYFFSCPENLRLGKSIPSFFSADRMVIGFRDSISKKRITNFFNTINNNLLWMKIESAEITKHAMNSFLATSITFINEISLICEQTNADVREVEQGLRSDTRIGKKAFLSPGSPFSGGTLGRDLNYLDKISKNLNINSYLLRSIKLSNENHKQWIYKNLKALIDKSKIKKVLIWGLSYTENTDTLRRSLGVEISRWLYNNNIKVSGYDNNIKNFPLKINKLIKKSSHPTSNMKDVDVLIILRKSKEFLSISPTYLKKLNRNLVIIDPDNSCNHLNATYKKQYLYVGKENSFLNKKRSTIKFKYNLKDQVSLVTGASKGLGYEISKSLLKSGSNLMICSRNHMQLKKAYVKLNKLKSKNQKIYYSATDISSLGEVKNLVKLTLDKFKKIDILVNNAGIYGPMGNIEKINWDKWVRAIEINMLGSILLCREVIPCFKKNNKGKIIQLSGGGAASPLPLISSYAVSKAGIVRFIENLSEEVKNYNIDINAVAPGPLNTDMLKEVLNAGPNKVGKNFYNKSLKQNKSGGTPFTKVCDLILFLSSRHSDGIKGKLISALWDDWKNWTNYKNLLKNSDAYTLRRVVGKDKGFEWGDK